MTKKDLKSRNSKKNKRQKLSLNQLNDFMKNEIYELYDEKHYIAVISQGILIAKIKAYVE